MIQMIKTIIAEVEKEIQTMKLEEKDAQEDYEKFVADAKAKRSEDSKSMQDKEGVLAETTEELVTSEEGLKNLFCRGPRRTAGTASPLHFDTPHAGGGG